MKRSGVAIAVLVATLAGTAWATGAVSSIVAPNGTINGCYKAQGGEADPNKGQLRVIAAGETCKQNELSLQWSQQGPKGETGATGPEGPEGSKGEQGPPGPDGPKGEQGEQGAAGRAGQDGAGGPRGHEGPQGAAGPQGPPGPAGAGLSDFDSLAGKPCNIGGISHGTISLSYANNGTGEMSLRCAPSASWEFTVTLSNASHGYVESTPAGIACGTKHAGTFTACSANYPGGTSVTVTAAPGLTHTFVDWGVGACSGNTTHTCTVTMDGPKSIAPQFSLK